MAEWLKAHAWKACKGVTLSWVRIPFSPPFKKVLLSGLFNRILIYKLIISKQLYPKNDIVFFSKSIKKWQIKTIIKLILSKY